MNAAFFPIWILAAVEHGRIHFSGRKEHKTSSGLTASFRIVEKRSFTFLVISSVWKTQKSIYVCLDFISPEEKMQNTYALHGYKFL